MVDRAVPANASAARERLASVCKSLGLVSAATYLFVLPYGHVTALRSASFLLALAAAASAWALSPRRLPLFGVLGVWLAIAGLSLVATRDFAASMNAIERDILRSFLVFFVFYTLAVTFPFYRTAVAATAVSIGLLSGLAVASVLQHGQWTSYYVPLLGEFTTSAITILPLLIGYLFVPLADRRVVLAVLIALPLTFLAGYMTLSRAFWVVISWGMLLAVACYAVRSRFRWRWTLAVVSMALFGLCLAAVVALERGRAPTAFSDRAPIYASAVRKIMANPVTGAGYGHEIDKAWYAVALPSASIYNPHNIVLGFVDQMGPAGLIALVAIFGVPAAMLARRFRDLPPAAAVPCIAAFALLGMVFLRNNADYFFLKHNLWLFFAHLGIYFGEIERTAGTRPVNAS